jgi:TonB family protein
MNLDNFLWRGRLTGSRGQPVKFSETLTLFLLCLLLAGTGCATSKQYPGPKRPSNQIATVICHNGGYLIVIDGKLRGIGLIRKWDLLPGEHVLIVAYTPLGGYYPPPRCLTLQVNLEAGHRYDLDILMDITNDVWSAIVKDKASGKIISKDLSEAYAEAVKNVYMQAWVPPANITIKTNEELYTTVAVKIKRDGAVIWAKITDPSDNQQMDDSVQSLLGKVKRLPPFENETIDEVQTLFIEFTLNSKN